MSDNNHTPGPWKWQGEDYRGGWGMQILVGPDGEGLIFSSENGGIPFDPKYCKTGMIRDEESVDSVFVFSKANADLIKSSPDLFEALEMVRDADEDCRKEGWPAMPEVARAKIDRALAKAKGEKQ